MKTYILPCEAPFRVKGADFMDFLENILWAYLTIPLLFAISIFFTIYAKGPQFRLKKMMNALQKSDSNEALTPVATLLIALSARIGVGTLAGTGLAIAIGGPGAIFWMWISAIITSAATFAENTLSQRFKQGISDHYYGGPAFYIKYGLKNKKLAALYAIILTITYTLGFVAIQMNTMTTVFSVNVNAGNTTILPFIIALILTFLVAATVRGNLTKISKFVAKIVPFIAIFFFGLAAVTLIISFTYIPLLFSEIITSAFDITSLTGGGIGIAITTGIKRGVFSNEAGLGTGAHAAALTHHENPQEQGYIGILGIYLTTIISVTLVAFMIMSTDAHNIIEVAGNGIEFLHFSLTQRFGTATSIILPTIIFFFGFSTVITAYLYGVMNIKFLSSKKTAITGLRILLLLTVFISAVSHPRAIWSLVDIGVGITAIINLIAIIMLRKHVKK